MAYKHLINHEEDLVCIGLNQQYNRKDRRKVVFLTRSEAKNTIHSTTSMVDEPKKTNQPSESEQIQPCWLTTEVPRTNKEPPRQGNMKHRMVQLTDILSNNRRASKILPRGANKQRIKSARTSSCSRPEASSLC